MERRAGVRGRLAISVTIPITNERPVSTSKTRRRARADFGLPLQSERLETAAPSSTSAGRDFPLGEPGFTYQDLHRDDRLADLDRAFLRRARAGERRRSPPGCGLPRRLRPPSTRSRAPACSSRRRGRSRPSSPGSSASRRSGGAQAASAGPGGRPLPLPARLPAAPGRQDEAARGPGGVDLAPLRAAAARARSAASTRSCRGRPTPSSRPRRWSAGCSTSRRTSSPRCARRRSPRSPPRRGRARSTLARRAAASAPACPAPPARPTRTCSPSSRDRSSSTPSGATCAASTRRSRPRDPRLGLLPAARDARLPEPRRDRAAQPGPARGARRARVRGGGAARASR